MSDKILIWCDYNYEQDMLEKIFGEKCVSIQGSTPLNQRLKLEEKWRSGDTPILITKPLCFGYGMNWQHCHNVIFFGMSDSYEKFYQAVRRCWRFGQSQEVNVWIVISAKEGCVKQNIERKQSDFEKMQTAMISLTKDITQKELKKTCRISTPYNPEKEMILPQWEEFKNESN